ncbi:hypothetical protein L9F63_001113 [Diploptera punctata]|uniref:Uncharacterized protein n=1 Tax=Diploptera punctata TaxID=6984 RepID=A0AAD8A4J1_DIPPU|nr:hypothetical protein L9F63_001113 [Diploptera punctata]
MLIRHTMSLALLNTAERSLVQLLQHITNNYFTMGRSVLITYPDKCLHYATRSVKTLLPKSQQICHIDVAGETLRILNENLKWATQTIGTNIETLSLGEDFQTDDIHYNYIVFLPALEHEYIDQTVDAVSSIVDNTALTTTNNPRGRWVILISDQHFQSYSKLAMGILTEIYENYYIYDVIIIMPNIKSGIIQKGNYFEYENVKNSIKDRYLLYSWLPFHVDGKQPILLDEWMIDTQNSSQSLGRNLFPPKLPPKGITINVTVSALENKLILVGKGNFTDDEGMIGYKYEGPEVNAMAMVAEHLNFSFRFGPTPSPDKKHVERILEAVRPVALGEVDMAIGALPLHPQLLPFLDFTHPYYLSGTNWFVPCPKPYPRLKRISETFPVSVWCLFALVIILTAIVTLFQSKFNKISEIGTYQSGVMCFYCMWAVILGVSVPNIPRTFSVRCLFLLFVWYAFVMNMLFQTFFTSYLVDPGIIDQVHTLEELIESDITMGYPKMGDMYFFQDKSDPILIKMHNRSEDIPYDTLETIVRKIIIDKNYAALLEEIYPEHLAKTMMPSKPLCYLDDRFSTFYLGAFLKKHIPISGIFKACLNRLIAGGLVAKEVNDMKETWNFRISPNANAYDDGDDEYFVFSVHHLMIGFYALAAGITLSSVLLIMEHFHFWLFTKLKK